MHGSNLHCARRAAPTGLEGPGWRCHHGTRFSLVGDRGALAIITQIRKAFFISTAPPEDVASRQLGPIGAA